MGARIERVDGGIRIEPISHRTDSEPIEVSVAVETSSQFASAVAMASASGYAIDLRLTTPSAADGQGAKMVSRSYFEMTLRMLEAAGVEITRQSEQRLVLRGADLCSARTLFASPDESSAAFWHVARYLGAPVEIEGLSEETMQSDRRIVSILREFEAHGSEILRVDLNDAPDLTPVLSVGAALSQGGLVIEGASHLRYKESNRIEQLVKTLAASGLEAQATEDGVRIEHGVQLPEAHSIWDGAGDHRLVFAGVLAAMRAPIVIGDAWAVTKSYPYFWRDVRRCGWCVETHDFQ